MSNETAGAYCGGGGYEAGKSRTFNVPIEKLYAAFANPRIRRRWLPATFTVRTATPNKAMRITWSDKTIVTFAFLRRGSEKSTVTAVQQKLPDRSAVDAVKKMWTAHFEKLNQLLS